MAQFNQQQRSRTDAGLAPSVGPSSDVGRITPPLSNKLNGSLTSPKFRVLDTRRAANTDAATDSRGNSQRSSPRSNSPKTLNTNSPPAGSPISILRHRHSTSDEAAAAAVGATSPSPSASVVATFQTPLSTASSIALLPRVDLDMEEQRDIIKVDRQARRTEEIISFLPTPLSDRDVTWMLKSLVVEAERYQAARQQQYLKLSVVTRAMDALGADCPSNYYQKTSASTVLFNDIDCVLALPKEYVPEGGALAFAVREVQAFPLWLPPRKTAAAVAAQQRRSSKRRSHSKEE